MRRLSTILVLVLVISASAQDDDEEKCDDFECPVKDGSFADPCTCRRYYSCVDFRPIKSFCPSGLYWDDIKKYCTYKNEAVCGPVASTPAPPTTTPPPDSASKCNEDECSLPWCYCSKGGTKIPAGLDIDDTPQMVLIMIDGAVNQNNFAYYRRIFKNLTNPNGCQVHGTFFLLHDYNNYHNIMDLRHDGHEMAVSSISDDKNLYLKNATAWTDELAGMRRIMNLQAEIGEEEVLGVRAPGAKPGYNTQYEVMIDYGFIWDSSISVPPQSTPVWPYTLDYAVAHKCKEKSCPTRQFPGLWEIPLNSHYVEGYLGGHCPYIDQCVFTHMGKEDILEWLKEDFNRHYTTNRAPYTLTMHTNWFTTQEQREALDEWLDWVQAKDEVYFVTGTQTLLWMTDPTPLSKLKSFEPWQCENKPVPPKPCKSPNKCSLAHREGNVNVVRYMTTCETCPDVYPWLGNTRGAETQDKDVYEKFSSEDYE